MLFPEIKTTYEKQIGTTKYIITSESLPDANRTIIDSLEKLMVRDFDTRYTPVKKIKEKNSV